MNLFPVIIQIFFRVLSILIIVDVVLSFFMSPYNQFRAILDKVVEPMLRPIRRIVPPVSNIDFSPVILLLILQLLEYLFLRII